MKKEEFAEVLGEINEKHILEARAVRRAKKPVWVKWGAMAACLCLVVVVALAAPTLQGEYGAGNPQPAKTNLLVVNEVENVMTADMDVQLSYYNNLSALEQETVLKEFQTANGLNYDDFTAKISDIYVLRSFYSMDVPADAARTEYIPHDYVFEYQTENGGEIRIAICSTEEPLRDYFIKCDNPKQSEINGITVVIYSYQDTFMVEFSHESINYDIETSNITMEELEDLLVGIME